MPEPRKLKVMIAAFAYGGNSGIANEHPSTRELACDIMNDVRGDNRISDCVFRTYNDTPITMLRNRTVVDARTNGVDVLVMLDSDHDFMYHADEPWYKPFFPQAFTAIYDHWDAGPLVIGAPYCGAAGAGENIFVFQWQNYGPRGSETEFSLEQFSRADACRMSGIQPVGALPTGMIMYDMRIFDLLDRNRKTKRRVLEEVKDGLITIDEGLRCIQDGYFYYEWTDDTASEKASTEDVAATRDMSLIGQLELGYNPVMCAWDSWIGHVKPFCSGKPKFFSTDQVGGALKRAVLDDRRADEKIVRVHNKELMQLLEAARGTDR